MDFSNWDTILAGYEGDPYRRFVMIPTITGLLPDLRGKRILDAGCGNGILIPHILKAGARSVVGIDKMPHLLDIARSRLPKAVNLYERDITQPLNISEAPFDGAVSNFVLNEVSNLHVPLQHIYDVLRPGAFLIMGVTHPTFLLGRHLLGDANDVRNYQSYFSGQRITDLYRGGGETIDFETYTFPMSAYVNAAIDTGFCLEKMCEPETSPEVVAANPDYYEAYKDFPVSVYFLLRRKL